MLVGTKQVGQKDRPPSPKIHQNLISNQSFSSNRQCQPILRQMHRKSHKCFYLSIIEGNMLFFGGKKYIHFFKYISIYKDNQALFHYKDKKSAHRSKRFHTSTSFGVDFMRFWHKNYTRYTLLIWPESMNSFFSILHICACVCVCTVINKRKPQFTNLWWLRGGKLQGEQDAPADLGPAGGGSLNVGWHHTGSSSP